MLQVNSIKFNNTKHLSFGEYNNNINSLTSSTAILSLQAPDAKREFAGYMNITQNADMVKTNPVKAIAWKFVKAYNEAVNSSGSNVGKSQKHISFTA